MKIKTTLLAISLLASGCATTHHSEHSAHWGYSGHEGPEYWGSLSPKYSTCSTGVNQSPVDLKNTVESELTPLKLLYSSSVSNIVNNGHTIQVNFQPGSILSVSDHEYELKQFHFHSPSENHINGRSYPLEAHFVHADKEGNLAVVAVMFEEGDENAALKDIWALMPEKAGAKNSQLPKISIEGILPNSRDYYRFNGSLTTPPCSEGVLWLVMKQSSSASKGQIQHFGHIINVPNNRPIQGTNARAILK